MLTEDILLESTYNAPGKFLIILEIETLILSFNEPNNDFAGSSLLILSSWALDSAFSTVVKAPSPRLGKPITRSKEEISALAVDKHEKALAGKKYYLL